VIASLASGRTEVVPTVGWDFGQIGSLLGDVNLPDSFGYRTKKYVRGTVQVDGHVINARHVGTYKARVCPECLEAFGFFPSHWDLKAYVACDIHGTMMLKNCSACGERIMVRRTSLLHCKCGADIRCAKADAAPANLLPLMKLLRLKVIGQPCTERDVPGFPASQFSAMDLDVMCNVLVHIAAVAMTIRTHAGTTKTSSAKVSAALPEVANVLADWPSNCHRFCEEWVEYRRAKGIRLTCFQKCFKWLFVYLHKNLRGRRNQTSFMLREATLWALANWEWKPVSIRGNWVGRVPLPDPEFCTTNAAASMSGLTLVQINRLIREGRITVKRIRLERRRTHAVLVSVESLKALKRSMHPSLTVYQAASRLGISGSLFSQLRFADLIVPDRWAPGKGIALEDIDAFKAKMVNSASTIRSPKEKVRLLDLLNSYIGWRKKMQVVESILDGGIASYCIGSRTLGNIWVDDAVRIHCKTRSRRLGSGWITVDGITKRYGLTYHEARSVVVRLTKSDAAPPIEVRKLQAFLRAYRPLMDLAEKSGTTTHAAFRWLRSAKVLKLEVGLSYRNGAPKSAYFVERTASATTLRSLKRRARQSLL
jgi:hypothetical protein